ncbi:hypothetical protein JMJ35_001996 [Cladonia borealis]|uniref:DUF3752 domain-containing protein n=1 Tax=Cladonia borealis TaxID=184061 RepID=A0AA39R6S7_9LECA|nr:hypothetical protein JMJ35_001996 [Cladonia borealis]
MSAVGPELPPHLQAKRKREDEEEAHDTPPKRPRSSSASSNENLPKRIIGPAPPPAPLSELPPTRPSPDAEEASSSSDDDFGPSLPPAPGSITHTAELQRQQNLEADIAAREASKKPQREEWMLVPPSQSDWTTRVDPTKLRNRKFNTGKGSKAPPSNSSSSEQPLWTETPEQKRQRLEDEVLGIRKPAQLGPSEEKRDVRKEEEARETERRIREFNEKNRGGSLLGEHKKVGPKEKEDDPSKRAFDREKDIGLGGKIGHKQKREMVERAKDFGSRFAGGNYL